MAWSQEECIAYLEQIRWNGIPQCPYCGSTHSSKIEQGRRHHCNECFTSYSVTVGTIFHKTHIPLEKWFEAIPLILKVDKPISVRKLAKQIGVSKNSAAHMIEQVRVAENRDQHLIRFIHGNIPPLSNNSEPTV
jgi:transposase-like protein